MKRERLLKVVLSRSHCGPRAVSRLRRTTARNTVTWGDSCNVPRNHSNCVGSMICEIVLHPNNSLKRLAVVRWRPEFVGCCEHGS
jgi:hypothetical protein